tara:strand:+ start:4402 stop:4812 length:411 start_codon:yes stop_codon:yes gene_type:complete
MPNYERNNGGLQGLAPFDEVRYKILPRVLENAKKLGVGVRESRDRNKKLDVFDLKTQKVISQIGGRYQDGKWYGDYATFLKRPKDRYGNKVDPEERRDLYLARHKHELKQKKSKLKRDKGKIINTPSYYADKILWS